MLADRAELRDNVAAVAELERGVEGRLQQFDHWEFVSLIDLSCGLRNEKLTGS